MKKRYDDDFSQASSPDRNEVRLAESESQQHHDEHPSPTPAEPTGANTHAPGGGGDVNSPLRGVVGRDGLEVMPSPDENFDFYDDRDEHDNSCDRCGGEGFIEYMEAGPDVWGEDCPSETNHLVTCPDCDGSGLRGLNQP